MNGVLKSLVWSLGCLCALPCFAGLSDDILELREMQKGAPGVLWTSRLDRLCARAMTHAEELPNSHPDKKQFFKELFKVYPSLQESTQRSAAVLLKNFRIYNERQGVSEALGARAPQWFSIDAKYREHRHRLEGVVKFYPERYRQVVPRPRALLEWATGEESDPLLARSYLNAFASDSEFLRDDPAGVLEAFERVLRGKNGLNLEVFVPLMSPAVMDFWEHSRARGELGERAYALLFEAFPLLSSDQKLSFAKAYREERAQQLRHGSEGARSYYRPGVVFENQDLVETLLRSLDQKEIYARAGVKALVEACR